MTQADPVRWGVLGVAHIATEQMLPAFREADRAELVAIASRRLDRARHAAQQFGAPRAYGSYEALIADPEVEAVYVPLPNHLHKPWSIAALRAGKHVLCEKPIALNAEEARQMQAAAAQHGRLLAEAFTYRHGPLMQRALEVVRSGALGDLKTLHSSFSFIIHDRPDDMRLQREAGGGALYDIGCYCISVLRTLAGREPVSVSARLSWSPKYHVDVAGAGLLDFGQELYGTFNANFNAPGTTFFRVVGTRGQMQAPYGFLGRERDAWLLTIIDGHIDRIMMPPINPYASELQEMSQAIRGDEPTQIAFEPLDANMRVVDACFASDRSGQAVRLS